MRAALTRPEVSADEMSANFSVQRTGDELVISGEGRWVMQCVHEIDEGLRELSFDGASSVTVDTTAVDGFDTSGAWLVERLNRRAEEDEIDFRHVDGNKAHCDLAQVMRPEEGVDVPDKRFVPQFSRGLFETIGRVMFRFKEDFVLACHLIGASIRGSQMKAGKRGSIRPISVIHQIDQMGLRGVPVIAVMSFLIGGIIAQQGAYQLRLFGEELLTVNLVGILLLREIGVLLTAIMVAGRSASAIAAEIGTMKMREEVDALQVIGLNPVGVLIFPRLLALIIVLPILTLLADIAGIAGAITVSWVYIEITPAQFMRALQDGVSLNMFYAGMIKAPFMALIIGLMGSIEGLKVGGSAESLGRHTTSAVVRSIFAVIIVDGLFAMFYTAIDF